MYIFYDFETSCRETIGQILGYSFILTDPQFQILDELTGWIRLNRTQCPEIDAILVNQIDLKWLQHHGDSEIDAVDKIYWFLDKYADRNPTLVGYNSNSFDLSFLRHSLIRYGRNPYFFGKLRYLDLLHWVRAIAFEHARSFPWQSRISATGGSYFSFKLEDMAKGFDLLHHPQSHDAREDVLLSMALARAIENRFNTALHSFNPIALDGKAIRRFEEPMAREKVPVYPEGTESAGYFSVRYWAPLLSGKTEWVLVDIERYLNLGTVHTLSERVGCLKYINLNKQCWIAESATPVEIDIFRSALTQIQSDPILSTLTFDEYFACIRPNWDIEHRSYDMGFERIAELRLAIDALQESAHRYPDILAGLRHRSSNNPDKDRYLIQLFNRAYLALHPNPDPAHLARYLIPRYQEGKLAKDPDSFCSFDQQLARLSTLTPENTGVSPAVIEGLRWYFNQFSSYSQKMV